MREYDEAIRLHNLDKFNSSNRRASDTRDSLSTSVGAGADLSKLQEIELAQFLQQRDSVSGSVLLELWHIDLCIDFVCHFRLIFYFITVQWVRSFVYFFSQLSPTNV